jgi:hypothetical protein
MTAMTAHLKVFAVLSDANAAIKEAEAECAARPRPARAPRSPPRPLGPALPRSC